MDISYYLHNFYGTKVIGSTYQQLRSNYDKKAIENTRKSLLLAMKEKEREILLMEFLLYRSMVPYDGFEHLENDHS